MVPHGYVDPTEASCGVQVWVLDARPGKVDASSGVLRDVERVLRAVREVPLPVPSRQWLAQQLQQKGFSPGELTAGSPLGQLGFGTQRYGFDSQAHLCQGSAVIKDCGLSREVPR